MTTFITSIDQLGCLAENTPLVFTHGDKVTLAWWRNGLVHLASGYEMTPFAALVIYGAPTIRPSDAEMIPVISPFVSRPTPKTIVVRIDGNRSIRGTVLEAMPGALDDRNATIARGKVAIRWEHDDFVDIVDITEVGPLREVTNVSLLALPFVEYDEHRRRSMSTIAGLSEEHINALNETMKVTADPDEIEAQDELVYEVENLNRRPERRTERFGS